MSPVLLENLIALCKVGSPEVDFTFGATDCAERSLQILGGKNEIREIIGSMSLENFTPAEQALRKYLTHAAQPMLENYHFRYLDAKSFLSFHRKLRKGADGKWFEVSGYMVKSFHKNGYQC